MDSVHKTNPKGTFDALVSNFLSVYHTLTKGMVLGYAEISPNDRFSRQGAGAQYLSGILTTFPTEKRSDWDVIQEE